MRSLCKWFPVFGRRELGIDEIFQEAGVELATADVAVMQAHLNAVMGFVPRVVDVDLTLLRTALDPFEGPHEPGLGWHRATAGRVVIHELPGQHHELLLGKARQVAHVMEGYLLRRDAQEVVSLSGAPSAES